MKTNQRTRRIFDPQQKITAVLSIWSERRTSAQAAERLGVSRKTFYKWEQRGLSALLDSVTDQPPGRPAHPPDDHRQWLEKQLNDANRQIDLLNRKMALKDVLMDLKLPETGRGRTKKK